MWVVYENYVDTYFFLVNPICHCRVIALFKVFDYIVSLWKLVNKISQEPLEPGSWYLDHRLCLSVDDLINFW